MRHWFNRSKRSIPGPLMDRLRHIRAKFQTAKDHYSFQRELAGRPAWRDALSALGVLLRPGKTILFFPENTQPLFAAYDHCIYSGYIITKDPTRRFDAVVHRKNYTFADAAVFEPHRIPLSKIINGRCEDISKRLVGRVFAEVFGYELDVDPLTYTGRIVKKADANGAHNGCVLQGPLSEEEFDSESVYQRLIEGPSGRPGYFLDYRVPIHGGRIPLVYLKYRPAENRFKEYVGDEFVEPDSVFSQEEQALMCRMADAMHLDCGDLDVLRDSDGRIYVIDVNNTPQTHISDMKPSCRRRAMDIMAASYDRLLREC